MTHDRVLKAGLEFEPARRTAIAAAGERRHADAVAVRENAHAHLADFKTALRDAEAYEAELRAALPIEPTPEPTGRLIMPNISQINLWAPQDSLSNQAVAPNATPLTRSRQCKHGVRPPEMCDICSKWLTKEELDDALYSQGQSFFRFINSGLFAAVFHDAEHVLCFKTHESGADSQYEHTVDRGMLTTALEKYDVVIA